MFDPAKPHHDLTLIQGNAGRVKDQLITRKILNYGSTIKVEIHWKQSDIKKKNPYFQPPFPLPPTSKVFVFAKQPIGFAWVMISIPLKYNGFRSWTFHCPTGIIPQIIKNFINHSFNSTQWHCQEWRTYASILYYTLWSNQDPTYVACHHRFFDWFLPILAR